MEEHETIRAAPGSDFDVVEATIPHLRHALETGAVTSVGLVAAYLERIARHDRRGELLNSVPVIAADAFRAARESDERRASGTLLGPLDGIPYTVKDSYAVRGQSLAAGSPAFRELVAADDAFTVARLRAGGAICLGRTTMPPMANGGMQRGLYGRAESPYNQDYLTAAFASGSSNGSGTATAASFCSFGLAEETWSSGRAPASNNGLVAYTPSRGVISVRGNWPLVPTMDVVVPHTRSVVDLLEVLDVVVADDDATDGDFWRSQPWIGIPPASSIRPSSYPALGKRTRLDGVRLGVPRMYINRDAGLREPIVTRPSVIALWEQAREDLVALGAEVVEVDFPVVSNYEADREGAKTLAERGLVPERFEEEELWDLSMLWWDGFLRSYSAGGPARLADVDGPLIFPQPSGALPDRYGGDFDLADYAARARQGLKPLAEIGSVPDGVRGLEDARRVDLEEWMDRNGLDAVVFPAVADVAPSDADVDQRSADIAWRNGTWVANGNLVPRHLGIPTVTTPMGVMRDIRMPVGLTFAGAAYSDSRLLSYAAAFDAMKSRRTAPPLAPGAPAWTRPQEELAQSLARTAGAPRVVVTATEQEDGLLLIGAEVDGGDAVQVRLSVAGTAVPVHRVADGSFEGRVPLDAIHEPRRHSEWFEPYGALVVCVAVDASGAVAGAVTAVGGTAGIEEDALGQVQPESMAAVRSVPEKRREQ